MGEKKEGRVRSEVAVLHLARRATCVYQHWRARYEASLCSSEYKLRAKYFSRNPLPSRTRN